MLFSKKIVLDTNFLLIPGQFKVDIFEEIQRIADFRYKLYIFEDSLKELEKIALKGNSRDKTAAKIAKSLVEQKKISFLQGNPEKNVDDQIIAYSEKHGIIVATQDLGLKKKLKDAKLIVLKNKSHLTFA